MEVLSEAARRAKVPLVWQAGGTPEANNESLSQRNLDLVFGAASPARRESFYVSEPWWSSELVAVMPVDSAIHRDSDIRGRRLAVAPGIAALVADHYSTDRVVAVQNAVQVAEAACSGAAEAGLLPAMYLRQLLFAGSSACQGVSLRTIDASARIDYVLIARRDTARVVDRLKEALDEITEDGTLASIAVRHPPVSPPQATRLAEMLRIRYERRLWRLGGSALLVVMLLGLAFLLRQSRSRQRLKQANMRLAADLAARERAEAALRESEARFRVLLDSAPQTVLAVDAAGTIVFANAKTETMFGYAPGELTAHPVEILFPGRWRQRSERTVANLRGRRKDGSEFPIEIASGPVDSTRSLTILFVANTSERIALEEQLRESQKMDSIGQLAGGLAHEFNNLLTVIDGYSHLLLSELPQLDRLRQPVDKIAQASGRASNLTRQLLTFSHRHIASPKTISLNDLVQEIENMLRPLIREDIELVLGLHATSPWIHADPGQVEQALINLVVNARDAMPDGGRLTIETHNLAAGDSVLLRVSDTGMGMTPEVRARVFEPFFSTKQPGKGTGLGLSVVYAVVRQSGGSIRVYSEPALGTTFEILLPAVTGEVEIAEAPAAAPAPAPAGQETVLVAEDEPGVRDFICEVLRGQGYVVLTAGNGREALERMEQSQGQVNLLLTDAIMPEMGGAVLARLFSDRYPGIPVLRMSGHADSDTRADATTPLITKPFTAQDLLLRVRGCLSAGDPGQR